MKVILFWMLFPVCVYAQQTAFWETKFYFEDALGNKDSVTIGHDQNANGSFNPELGEVNIKDVPWDSIFEVRASHNEAAHAIATPKVLSKKIIGSTEGGLHPTYNCLFVREQLKLFVKIKNLPLKVSWVKSNHGGFCNSKDFLTPHILPQLFKNWWDEPEFVQDPPYVCLANDSSYTINDFTTNTNGFVDFILEKFPNETVDTIHGLLLTFLTQSSGNSPCAGIVNVKDLLERDDIISVYPNPTYRGVNIRAEDSFTWELYDNQSRLITKGAEILINLENHPLGLYFLKIKLKDKIITKKILKEQN